MKDNRGFSLVEIIVAIAIIGVLVGGSFVSINLIARTNVEKGIRVVESTMGKLQTECLSKSKPTYMYVYQDSDDGDYYVKVSKTLHTSVSSIMSDDAEAERIEISSVDMHYYVDKSENGYSAGPHKIENGNFIAVTYKKGDSSVVGYANGGTQLDSLFRIEALGADRYARVEISYETGKVTYDTSTI